MKINTVALSAGMSIETNQNQDNVAAAEWRIRYVACDDNVEDANGKRTVIV